MCAQYRISLSEKEVANLKGFSNGKHNAKLVLYARALLLMDKGSHTNEHWSVDETAKAVGVSARTLNHLKEKFTVEGYESIFCPRPTGKSKRPIKFDGEFEAKLTQIACDSPPEGHARWTVRLLAEKLVELKVVDKISTMTVHRALKKTNLSLT